MRNAIVGYGIIGHVHAQVFAELGEQLVAVCDNDPARLSDVAASLRYSDYTEMLDKVRPDVVHICTPHYLHTEMILEALRRDIHVLCEKPLCIKKEDIPVILEAEKNSRAQLGVCFQNRYNPENVFAKEWLSGKHPVCAGGNVVWHRDASYYRMDAWRGKWATEGGGVLINQSIHTLDLLVSLLGEPESVTASLSDLSLSDVIEVEDTAVITAKGKTPFTFFATNASAKTLPVEYFLRTEEGTLRVAPRVALEEDGTAHYFGKENKLLGKGCYGSGHSALIADFNDCVKTGRHFPLDGAEAAKTMRTVFAAYESRGKEVKL